MALSFLVLALSEYGVIGMQFETSRLGLYGYMIWATCLCVGQMVLRGEQGKRVLFILPGVLFVVAMVVFPLCYAILIGLSDWNLASPDGRQFNRLDNVGRSVLLERLEKYGVLHAGHHRRIRHRLWTGADAGPRHPRTQILSRGVFDAADAVAMCLEISGLSRFRYRLGFMRNPDISFFFLSQLILPPVVLALPFLVLYKQLALLDTRIGLILLYTLTVLPIVIWIMRDQFQSIPVGLEEAALVDGLSIWGRSCR